MKQETRKEIISWIIVILAAVLSALFINGYIIVHANVPTGSMLDTIQLDSRVVGLKLTYRFSDPQRFDIVVFPFPDDESQLYVKRIIGMPGDTVTIRGGKVYINNDPDPLPDFFIKEPQREGMEKVYNVPKKLPEDPNSYDGYFMMGDNRNDSADSREWNHPFLQRDKIIGKLYFSYYPQLKWFGKIKEEQ